MENLVMPLRDHFRPPLDLIASWEGFLQTTVATTGGREHKMTFLLTTCFAYFAGSMVQRQKIVVIHHLILKKESDSHDAALPLLDSDCHRALHDRLGQS